MTDARYFLYISSWNRSEITIVTIAHTSYIQTNVFTNYTGKKEIITDRIEEVFNQPL